MPQDGNGEFPIWFLLPHLHPHGGKTSPIKAHGECFVPIPVPVQGIHLQLISNGELVPATG
jgi:hypothetical protein